MKLQSARFRYVLLACLCVMASPLVAATQSKDDAAPTQTETPAAAQTTAPGYVLGQGLPIGDTGFTLGGYASLQYQNDEDADPRLSLSHTSLFLWWEGASRWKFFSELDYEDAFASHYGPPHDQRAYLALERFYLDYAFSDSLTIRGGKFLTPIGRWNEIHADPLVWTTSRPLITRNVFPGNATGIMARGNLEVADQSADYALYASHGPEWHSDPQQEPFNDATGLRLNLPVGENWQFGASYASFDLRGAREDRKQLLGFDFLWARDGYEVSAETAYRSSRIGARYDEKGGFLQVVVPLRDKLYAVGRIEAFRQADVDPAARLYVLGLNYRYSRAISLKAEIVHGIHNEIGAPEGFLSSVSVLF